MMDDKSLNEKTNDVITIQATNAYLDVRLYLTQTGLNHDMRPIENWGR